MRGEGGERECGRGEGEGSVNEGESEGEGREDMQDRTSVRFKPRPLHWLNGLQCYPVSYRGAPPLPS